MIVLLATHLVRLVLVLQRPVGAWLRSQPAAAPVWQPETGQWATPQRGSGTALAVLEPVGALAVATLLVLGTAPESSPTQQALFGWVGSDPALVLDPYAMDHYDTDRYGLGLQPGQPMLHTDSTDYADLYRGGTPVEPPASGDPSFDKPLDPLARSCFDGSTVARRHGR